MKDPIVWDFDPEIIDLGFLAPRWYGLCFAAAIFVGYVLMKYIFTKEEQSEEAFNSGFTMFVVGTIVGARLGHCLFYEPAYYLANPLEIFMVWKGGLASHGGTIGITLAMLYFCYKWRMPFMWLADRLAMAVPLGAPFVRLGNFFNSEIIGKPTDVPWAVVFKRIDEVPRHPAQLYESLAYLPLFFILFAYYQIKGPNLKPGRFIGTMFIWIFSWRFVLEFFKENQEAFEEGMAINMGQILSIPMVLLGVAFLFGIHNKFNLDFSKLGPPPETESDKQKSGSSNAKDDRKAKRKAQKEAKKKNR